jgi:hypothetical protein
LQFARYKRLILQIFSSGFSGRKRGMKRRVFLRRISTALTGMGLGSQLSVPIQSLLPVLAQSSGRKLALLVGINHYTNHSHNSNPSQLPPIAPIPLNGCVTDVELQRELLIHRFGFRPSDILTLTNEEATRTNIESAFVESSFPASTVRGSGSFSFQRLWESITSS